MMLPLLLAPMAELSYRPLRELIETFGGCDEYFTGMISAGALTGGGRFESCYLDALPRPEKVVYQLVGARADQLAAAARILDRLDCKGIDINMGCSAPAITRTGAGIRWMQSPDAAGALIRTLRPRVSRRLSVKLRLGMEEDFAYLVRFCRRLAEEGVERITLHPRTGREKFKRSARWEYVAMLRRELDIPVAGNGDIASAAELRRKALIPGNDPPYDAVMAGRSAVRAPWIFREAKTTGAAPCRDLEALACRFLEVLGRCQPEEFQIQRARRFFSYFCDNLIWANYLKTRLAREKTLAGMEGVLRGYFKEHHEERMGGGPAG